MPRQRPNVRTRGATLRTGRMPCPECGNQLSLPLEAMFSGAPIPCTKCGSTLAVNVQESQTALQALRKAEAMVERIRGMSRGG